MNKHHRSLGRDKIDVGGSERTKEQRHRFDQDECPHSSESLDPEQEFLIKRLEETLTSQIKFVHPKQDEQEKLQNGTREMALNSEHDGVYLFTASTQRLSARDLLENENVTNSPKKRVIREIKRRKLQDDEESDDESAKLKSVAVSSDWAFTSTALILWEKSFAMDKKSTQRQKRQSKGLEENFWDCSVCTFRNTAEAFKCAMCDVRKGTSTRKPRLNPQLVAQQVAQHMTASAITPKPQPRREGSKERKQIQGTLSNSEEKPSKKKIRNIRPRLKNVDRSQVHSQPVTVNNVTVVITEYLPKSAQSSTSELPVISTDGPTCPTANHSELPNGAHIPPPPQTL